MSDHHLRAAPLVTTTQAIANELAGRHTSERRAPRHWRVPLDDDRPDVSVLIYALDTVLLHSFDNPILL